MLFLVDGYNVTRRDPATAALSLQDQRESLAARLRVRGRELLGAGRVVIVFDGEAGPGLSTGGEVPVRSSTRAAIADDDRSNRVAFEGPVVWSSVARWANAPASADGVRGRAQASTCQPRGTRRKKVGSIARDAPAERPTQSR
jgi:hypothetical protein